MNYSKFFVLVFVLLSLVSFAFSGDFEGKIMQKALYVSLDKMGDVSSMPQAEALFSKSIDELKQMAAKAGGNDAYSEQKIDIFVKGNKFRMDTQQKGQQVSIIYDTESDKMITLMHEKKMAMATGMGKMMQMGEQMGQSMGMAPGMMGKDKGGDDFSMEATGKSKTINGFECKLYKGTDSSGDFTHMWIHEGYIDAFQRMLTSFGKMEKSKKQGMQKEEKFFKKVQGIPILTKSASKEDLNINEILNIAEQSVPADKFEVPDDYQTMDMQNMMQQQMQKMKDMMKK